MSKLYVTNLAQSASLASVRQCFAACGEVVGVEMVPERGAARATSAAYVTMATQAAAERAADSLHGTVLLGRSLMISVATQPESHGRKRDSAKNEDPDAGTKIAQQYRERQSMTYELACGRARLTLRIFFPEEQQPSRWRVEARTNRGDAVVEATESSRELALLAVADAWRALPLTSQALELDWQAVVAALKAVRAI